MLHSVLAAAALSLRGAPAPRVNPVERENSRAGTTSWQPTGAATSAIEGYASEVSALPGSKIRLHVSTNPVARYRIEVFRLGWYGGRGGRPSRGLPGGHRWGQGVREPPPPPPPARP